MTTTNDEIDFDISQLDDTLISDTQKQTLLDYINQLKNKKNSIHDEFNQFKTSTDERFHQLSQEYESIREQVDQQRQIEEQFKQDNNSLKIQLNQFEQEYNHVKQNEQQLQIKFETTFEQVRQLTNEREQLKNSVQDKENQIHDLQKQREIIEEENHQVHQTNTSTIARLQQLENTSSQVQNLENLWNKERQLYVEQIQTSEQSLIESKKKAIEQETTIMQLTVQLDSNDGQFQAHKRSFDTTIEEKNQSILNLDRQLREKIQKTEQLQLDLQRINRQNENQQSTSDKTIQSFRNQIDELTKKITLLTEQCDEQKQNLVKITIERDVLKNDIRTLTETNEKQTIENEQTIRRLQDELDNTTQLLESIRSKGADLTQLTNFLDGTLSHIRSNETPSTPLTTTNCFECRQLKSALVLELTGKERFRFGYEQLSSMIKEAAPILRRQKQDYEASFEVIAKLTSELNEARKELSDLQHLSGESIENYRYIQREKQFLMNDNKSLATKIQVLLAEIEELRTGKRPSDSDYSTDIDPNQQVPLTFRNVVELQHVNQKLDKLVREMRAQNENTDEDLNRKRFDELKKEHQQQQEKFKETKTQLESLETQMNSLIQERDFLRLLVSRSSSSQNTSTNNSPVDVHQIENLRDQIKRLQEKFDNLTKKNIQLTNEKDEHTRNSSEKIRSIQYELLTARTEIEQTNDKFHLINEELSTNKLTIASLRTEINSWQQRHSMLVQIRNKQEQQYFNVLNELRQLKGDKTHLDSQLNRLENEKKFDSIKYEQIENECQLLKNEITKNEQIQPVIEKLQTLAESTKEKTKIMFETKINDLINETNVLNQRIEQNEREKDLLERQYQTHLDELTQNVNQEKFFHQEHRTKYIQEKDRAEQLQQKLNDIENRLNSNTIQKTDFEQQLGDYEKELKMLRVKLDAANNELELKQTLIQSSIENANQSDLNGQKAIEQLEKSKQESIEKLSDQQNKISQLTQELLNSQTTINEYEENVRSNTERIQILTEQHQIELTRLNEQIDQSTTDKTQFTQQIEQITIENEQLKERLTQLESTFEQQQIIINENEIRLNSLIEQNSLFETNNQRYLNDIQQYQTTLIDKTQTIQTQQDLIKQTEQNYTELEQKHLEQHNLMMKLSTHLAAKESETQNTTTNENEINETWNTILSMNNYLRVENLRLTDELERIQLTNAHLNQRLQTIEQNNQINQQTIDELKLLNQSLESQQEQYNHNQQHLKQIQEKYLQLEQDKLDLEQTNKNLQRNINQLNQQENQIKQQIEINDKQYNEQLIIKTTENDELKSKITKIESENQELKQMTTRLRQIAIKYRDSAASGVTPTSTSVPTSPAVTTTTSTADDIVTSVTTTETASNRTLPVDITEKTNRVREALVASRVKIAAQQTRLTQMTNEFVQIKQNQISTDLTDAHVIIENIRQIYETEINELKQIILLFDSTDVNEQMAEIVRLRKKIDELQANNRSLITNVDDVTPKPSTVRPEPAISRVVPIAPATGRQIGVATPMTASTTATTTSTPLWTAATATSETSNLQATTTQVVDHSTTQITTAAGVNLLMKRTRTDDGEQSRPMESTSKRTRPDTDTQPLIAHVEPQVREQQTPIQESTEIQETNIIDTSRTDIVSISMETEGISSSIEGTSSIDSSNEIDSRPNTQSTMAVIINETMPTTTTSTTTEQPTEQRRSDILPIVYDVQSIPTIGSGGPIQVNRGGIGRTRPPMNTSIVRRPWALRGPGGGRGGPGGRGGSGVGPSARQ